MESTRRRKDSETAHARHEFLIVERVGEAQQAARGGGVETERGGVRRSFSGGGASPARARDSRAAPREVEAEASVQIWRLCLTGHARLLGFHPRRAAWTARGPPSGA